MSGREREFQVKHGLKNNINLLLYHTFLLLVLMYLIYHLILTHPSYSHVQTKKQKQNKT